MPTNENPLPDECYELLAALEGVSFKRLIGLDLLRFRGKANLRDLLVLCQSRGLAKFCLCDNRSWRPGPITAKTPLDQIMIETLTERGRGLLAAWRFDGVKGKTPDGQQSFTSVALRQMTGLSSATLPRYAKAAGVKTPHRGQRTFRYSAADARLILKTIINTTSEIAIRTRCQTALNTLAEIDK